MIRRVARRCAIAGLLLAAARSRALAQSIGVNEVPRADATRAELDSMATTATAVADATNTPSEKRDSLRRYAAALRLRLQSGDFQPGDRVIMIMRGDSTRIDTLTVQSDRTIIVPPLPAISVDGVLRSELQRCISDQLQQYVRNAVVRVIPLVSVGVLGEVVHPGYYRVPLQISLGDLLMVAGGPSAQADMNRVEVRRGQAMLIDQRSVRDALVHRLLLGQMGIDAGDEVVVQGPRQHNWLLITQLAGVATGLVLGLHSLKIF